MQKDDTKKSSNKCSACGSEQKNVEAHYCSSCGFLTEEGKKAEKAKK